MTNQYAKSNQRSEIEDKLKQETGIDVRVFDLSWLLDQTFKHGYENIAIETLSISTQQTSNSQTGPNDYKKELELEAILDKIKNNINPQLIPIHQVGIFLDAAILSKEIEKGILETQGLFDRAVSIANKFGTNRQQFDAYYEYAWAAYWWFEDFTLFEDNLEKAFKCIKNSTNSTKWEKIVTLINVHHGYLQIQDSDSTIDIKLIKSKTNEQLTIIAENNTQSSNSLQVKTSLVLLDLLNIKKSDDAKSIFTNLLVIAKDCKRLIGYSFDSLNDLMLELDQVFGDLLEYETLIDYLTEQSANRYGEVQTSLNLLRRGAKRLESGKPYQAIKLIGKSLIGLYKHESQNEIVTALNIISHAYIKVELLWAARGSALLAASLITNEFWKNDEINPAQVKAYMRLAWLELKLGRICHSLTWLKLAFLINNNLKKSIISDDEILNFDGYMGHCLLRQELSIIKTMERLPDVLDKLGLFSSRAMMLYCLGHTELVYDEFEIITDDEFVDYLLLARDYDFGINKSLINTFSGRSRKIISSVLGCQITISFPLKSPLVELAESILSVIEGFCSTGFVDNAIAIESNLNIDIWADDHEEISISHEIESSGSGININVTCSDFTPEMLNASGQKIIQVWLQTFIIEVYSNIIMPKQAEKNIKSLLVDDKALERSISFGACFTTQYNVLGENAIKDISMVIDNRQIKAYKTKRSKNWDNEFPIELKSNHVEHNSKKSDTFNSIFNNEKITHSEISTHGLIRIRLWDKAKWSGTGFLMHPDGIPGLSFLFEDEQAANNIFTNLLTELGKTDPLNRLRVSLIRKISSSKPFNYRILVTENMRPNETKIVATISRLNTMTPKTDKHIKDFLTAYKKTGRYGLSYGYNKNGQLITAHNLDEITIIKNDLIIKDAWEIGPNDFESMAIKGSDTPIIPDHITNPPVIETLNKIKKSKN